MTVSQHAQAADHDKIDALATVLIEARTGGRPLDGLPPGLVPSDAAEALLVDDRVAELSGWDVLGWKIGCTSEHAKKLLGSPGPFAGRVYSVFESGAELGPDQLAAEPKIEGEFALTIGTDLKPGAALDRDAVTAAISEVRPAIELVGGRYVDFLTVPLLCLVADAGANSHLVVGSAAAGFDPADLINTVGTMTVDGVVTGQGSGADVLDDPVLALMWLLTHLGERGITLTAGQVVTTGTLTQVSELPVGSTAVARFGDVGQVTVRRGDE